MTWSNLGVVVYAVFLLIILIINLLYFFQVFRYRLPGDYSLPVTVVYVIIMIVVLFAGGILVNL